MVDRSIMSMLSFPDRQAADTLYGKILLVVLIGSLAMAPEVFFIAESGADESMLFILYLMALMPVAAVCLVAANFWFGAREIDVTERGVRVRRCLFGLAWKSVSYPAARIVGFEWARTIPLKPKAAGSGARERSAYRFCLALEGGTLAVVLTTRRSADIRRLWQALAAQWPDRAGSALDVEEEEA